MRPSLATTAAVATIGEGGIGDTRGRGRARARGVAVREGGSAAALAGIGVEGALYNRTAHIRERKFFLPLTHLSGYIYIYWICFCGVRIEKMNAD